MADRISNLPDPILCHILSFLPTKLAATTTVLSRRWKSLYLQLSILDFNDETFQHLDSFINFIYTTTSARDITLPVHSLTFKCTNTNSLIHNQLMVNGVLDFVFERLQIENLNSLEIIFHENLTVLLPRRICSCKNLRVLKLNYVFITDSSSSSGLDFDFPLLKVLHWNGVMFLTPECFVKFISSCPELEELHAYSLQYISLAYDLDEKFKPFPNLAIARIFDYNIPITFLSEVQSLRLQMNRRWIRCNQLPLFHRLTNIDIIFTDVSNVLLEEQLKWLLQLLQHCPILQNFTIQDCQNGHQNQMVGNYWIDPPAVPQCLSSQLKTFFLRGYNGNGNEFQFVRYIMQNSKIAVSDLLNKMDSNEIEQG